MRLLVALCALLALSVGVATATAGNGGNSANAKLCYKDGWQTLYTSTGGTFADQDECVSYAAQGGTLLTSPPSRSQFDCQQAGGTFTAAPGGSVLWTCGPLGLDSALFAALEGDCLGDGGSSLTWTDTDLLYRCSAYSGP